MDLPASRLTIEYRLLGPLEIIRDGSKCTPQAPKQRALLALLIYHANELMTAHRIIDELWESRPPASAHAILQMHVSAVRRALLPSYDGVGGDPRAHPILRTDRSGYIMCIEPEALDLTRFRALANRGRFALNEGRCVEAGEHFREALALWRGAALADLGHTGMLAHYALRLDEERLAIWQERIGADMCQGCSAEVVGELEELCAKYPLREFFYEQLMYALYHSGRRAEALKVYIRAHQVMVESIGIEPGPGLCAAQQAILSGQPLSASRHAGHRRSAC